MKTLKFAGLAFIAVLLILAGITIVQYQQAVGQWQAEVMRLNAEVGQLRVKAESDYYRGVLSSCVGIGMKMGIARELVSTTCTNYMNSAYEADWFNELQLDSWTWPPEKQIRIKARAS